MVLTVLTVLKTQGAPGRLCQGESLATIPCRVAELPRVAGAGQQKHCCESVAAQEVRSAGSAQTEPNPIAMKKHRGTEYEGTQSEIRDYAFRQVV